jgi:hypothetical protein
MPNRILWPWLYVAGGVAVSLLLARVYVGTRDSVGFVWRRFAERVDRRETSYRQSRVK